MDLLLLLAAPIALQQFGFSPFWLIGTASLWNLVCRHPAMREHDVARVAEIHGEKAAYLVWVKAVFHGALGVSYAIDRWVF
jgi:hypothetical protein